MSACDESLREPLRPAFPVGQGEESQKTRSVIETLGLQSHPEGGYYKETDRDALSIPNPFQTKKSGGGSDSTRSASTTIYYMVTPKRHDLTNIPNHSILIDF
jgi:predicted cupin superfamily sugar epimerase